MTRPHLCLFLITLFTAITRIWNFWGDRMHVDEYFTLNLVKYDVVTIVIRSLTTDCNPPLFYLIDHFSIVLFGADQFGQRLPSVIFGILLIPSVYWLGKEYKDERLGLLNAAVMATMGSMWYYSGFGRSYMLNCLLFTVFCVFYLRIVQKDDGRLRNWYGLSLFSVLLAYSHLYTVIPLAVLWFYLFIKKTAHAISFSILSGIAALPLTLLFQAILRERTISRDVAKTAWNWYGISWQQIVLWSPLEFFGFCAFLWIPVIGYAVWNKRKEPFVVMITLAFVSAYAGLIVLSDTTPVFIRYVILFLPVLCMIGLTAILDFLDDDTSIWPRKTRILFLLLLAFIYVIGTIAPFITGGFYVEKGLINPKTDVILV